MVQKTTGKKNTINVVIDFMHIHHHYSYSTTQLSFYLFLHPSNCSISIQYSPPIHIPINHLAYSIIFSFSFCSFVLSPSVSYNILLSSVSLSPYHCFVVHAFSHLPFLSHFLIILHLTLGLRAHSLNLSRCLNHIRSYSLF